MPLSTNSGVSCGKFAFVALTTLVLLTTSKSAKIGRAFHQELSRTHTFSPPKLGLPGNDSFRRSRLEYLVYNDTYALVPSEIICPDQESVNTYRVARSGVEPPVKIRKRRHPISSQYL